MGVRLYVGNLPYEVDDVALAGLARGHGRVVAATVVVDRETGRNRGFGFIEMGSDAEAEAVRAALDGVEHAGRRLVAHEAREKPQDRPDFEAAAGFERPHPVLLHNPEPPVGPGQRTRR
jgi:RNA recognition motif-containing protein